MSTTDTTAPQGAAPQGAAPQGAAPAWPAFSESRHPELGWLVAFVHCDAGHTLQVAATIAPTRAVTVSHITDQASCALLLTPAMARAVAGHLLACADAMEDEQP